MQIGGTRPEEAKVFDDHAGYAQFIHEDGEAYGSFEVFWTDSLIEDACAPDWQPGWYWWACSPGYLPDSDPTGPFSTSYRAYADAREED